MAFKKIAVLFPGQGAQFPGMCSGFYDPRYPVYKSVLERAQNVLNLDIVKIINDSTEDQLKNTAVAQPAIFAVSIGVWEFLKQTGIEPQAFAGHSIGEYSAITASGALSFDDGLKLVHVRGQLMNEASVSSPGVMAAIIGLERNIVEEICQYVKKLGVCEPVNYNCPGQVVISGHKIAVDEALKMAKARGTRMAVQLNVQGAFHSCLMRDAARKLAERIAKTEFLNPKAPVILNYDAMAANTADEIKAKLSFQMDHPVRWEETMRKLVEMGIETFIEVGPGKVLAGLLRRINDKCAVFSVDSPAAFEKMQCCV